MSQAPAAGRPTQRYGRPAGSDHRTLVIVGAVVVTLITAYVAWLMLASNARTVHSSKLSDSVVDASHLEVTFQVTMSPGERAVCTVRAKDADLAIVGWSDVTVGPSAQESVTTTVQIPTMQQAAGGEVKACVPD